MAIAAVTMLVWQPWRHDPEPAWSNRLLVDLPTNLVIDAAIEQSWPGGLAGDIGYVFAEPGAVLPFLQGGKGRSASWNSTAVDSVRSAFRPTSDGTPEVLIQGVPARVAGVDGSVVRIAFGPLKGRYYDVTTNGMSTPEALGFAENIAVDRGQPELRDNSVLLGMEPVGTVDDYYAALTLLNIGFGGPTSSRPTTVKSVRASGGIIVISSLSDGDESGALLNMALLLFGADSGATVRGHPALAREVRSILNNDQEIVSVVAWHERGRFIVISSSGSVDETLALAATTHEAGDDEWAAVASTINQNIVTPAAGIGFRIATNGSLDQLLAASSGTDATVNLCLETQPESDARCTDTPIDGLPLLTLVALGEDSVVLAMASTEAVSPELHITHSDGTVDIHILFRPTLGIPGPAVAVFLPADFKSAALLIHDEVVATF